MTTVHMFAGQGSQRPGMGGELFDRFPALTEEADDVLGYSVRELCLTGGRDGQLDDTRYTQPAVYVVNALAHRALLEEERAPDAALGHSLGEYNALAAAGVFTFSEGLRLVAARAEAMAAVTGGGLSVVVGLKETLLRFLLHRSGFGSVHLANLNSPDQLVLAGPRDDLEMMELILEDAGARMARRLPVSGPFHSPHMSVAAQELGPLLAATPFRAPRFPVIANTTGRPHRFEELAATLTAQIDHPVRWTESVEYLLGRAAGEAPRFVEVGGSTVLTGMVRRIVAERRERGTPSPGPDGSPPPHERTRAVASAGTR
ncbi:trans-AT polyketide synthase, acyltransferase and oxidoreductase domain-containing protein [Streptomyces sp. WMMB 714]|jgi:malonyl CoA-acyl carrier protein transacylase|uniref:ACP S-malonyltransferase n=1 Tax=Streptomyces sp. WMMB 714 TaxID=1286822 RepID=UPI000698AF49|nr:ACP S-malonyltransferase [Streptomyces sp. WMMB 714]SCK31530.1 trans-AT polyketide synthase, acyltransferase and oxidoreductase domain-containing protein [Streptomyces sp. WMMB 714]